jgi:hypothetical protein
MTSPYLRAAAKFPKVKNQAKERFDKRKLGKPDKPPAKPDKPPKAK